jgi:undecaprenyl-diphosphatase
LADLAASAAPVDWSALGTGLVVAAVSAWLCIKAFIAFVQRIGMLPFVVYRLALAAVLVYAFV